MRARVRVRVQSQSQTTCRPRVQQSLQNLCLHASANPSDVGNVSAHTGQSNDPMGEVGYGCGAWRLVAGVRACATTRCERLDACAHVRGSKTHAHRSTHARIRMLHCDPSAVALTLVGGASLPLIAVVIVPAERQAGVLRQFIRAIEPPS